LQGGREDGSQKRRKAYSRRDSRRLAKLSGYLLSRARRFRFPIEVNLERPLRCLKHDRTVLAAIDVAEHFPGDGGRQSTFEVLADKANCIFAIHDPDANRAD